VVVALSAIPGLLAVSLIAFGVKEPARVYAPPREAAPLAWSALNQPTRRYLSVLAFFALGKIPETFLLLRGHELGMPVVELLLLWAALHVVKSSVSEYAGRRADIHGRRPLILAGWLVYALALAGLAFAQTNVDLWTWSLVLGLYFGLTEGAERALVRDLAPAVERGTAFGWFHMLVGMSAIPAGVLLGGLWAYFDAKTAFLVSAAVALAASALFWRYVRTSGT
jgi:MFS family permease